MGLLNLMVSGHECLRHRRLLEAAFNQWQATGSQQPCELHLSQERRCRAPTLMLLGLKPSTMLPHRLTLATEQRQRPPAPPAALLQEHRVRRRSTASAGAALPSTTWRGGAAFMDGEASLSAQWSLM